MLVEFSVENYLSFKDRVVFSMAAAPATEHEETNIFAIGKERFLRSAAIYGANGSGKSNLLKAIKFMREFVINSSRESQSGDPIPTDPFRLSTTTEHSPSLFEVVFVYDNTKYRYGFQADRKEVVTEWLYYTPNIKEKKLFTRERDKFSIGADFKEEGKGLETRTRDNALYLSVVAQFNGRIAEGILRWFRHLYIISGLDDSTMELTTLQLYISDTKAGVIDMLQSFDLGFDNIVVKTGESNTAITGRLEELWKTAGPDTPISKLDTAELFTIHQKYDANMTAVATEEFSLHQNESDGTQKLVGLSGVILTALTLGKTLLIDELDARLHPILTQKIINIFNSPLTNPNNAQLIFATHDTHLLSNKFFRRDQIWFTEKDQYGASNLYSLIEYKGVRTDSSYGKDYILGKYGAIPFVGDFHQLIGTDYGKE